MASAVYILDQKGKILISRNYRGDVPLNIAERFVAKILEEEEELNVKPVIEEEGVSFLYVRHNNLYCALPIYHARRLRRSCPSPLTHV